MAVIETSYLDNPQSDAKCILDSSYGITLVDVDNERVYLDASSALNLLDFLARWKREIRNAAEKAEGKATDKQPESKTVRVELARSTEPETVQVSTRIVPVEPPTVAKIHMRRVNEQQQTDE